MNEITITTTRKVKNKNLMSAIKMMSIQSQSTWKNLDCNALHYNYNREGGI